MFKPHIGNCICHNKNRWIVVRAGYCAQGNQDQKDAKRTRPKPVAKPRKALKRTALTYKRKNTGEKSMFEEIWNERPRVSFVNGEPLTWFDISIFAHVIPKAKNKYPIFKLYKKCIVLLSREQHDLWDNGSREDLKALPEWNKMFELEAELKAEYVNKINPKR